MITEVTLSSLTASRNLDVPLESQVNTSKNVGLLVGKLYLVLCHFLEEPCLIGRSQFVVAEFFDTKIIWIDIDRPTETTVHLLRGRLEV